MIQSLSILERVFLKLKEAENDTTGFYLRDRVALFKYEQDYVAVKIPKNPEGITKLTSMPEYLGVYTEEVTNKDIEAAL